MVILIVDKDSNLQSMLFFQKPIQSVLLALIFTTPMAIYVVLSHLLWASLYMKYTLGYRLLGYISY